MKKLFVLLIFTFSFSLYSCYEIESKIAVNINPLTINDIEKNNFYDIEDIFRKKDIIILGESTHGDGKTLEIKSKLVKFLVEKKGFNTIAFEGRGFLDMEFLNTQTKIDTLARNFKKTALFDWYGKNRIQILNDVINDNDLKFIGVESYSMFLNRDPDRLIDYLMKFVAINYINNNIIENLDKIKATHRKINFSIIEGVSKSDIDNYVKTLKDVENLIQNDSCPNEEKLILKQSLQNLINYSKLFWHLQVLGNDNNIDLWNNLRDEQMFLNIKWHKNKYPDSKIIVWTANFHGAKSIKEIQYKEDNPNLYLKYTLLGEHLKNTYKEKLYSVAFTSSRGKSALTNENAKNIIAPKGTLEFKLDKMSLDFGFIDFSKIKKNNSRLLNKSFKSIILGHDNKSGKWLKVYDGIFYIKENEPIY